MQLICDQFNNFNKSQQIISLIAHWLFIIKILNFTNYQIKNRRPPFYHMHKFQLQVLNSDPLTQNLRKSALRSQNKQNLKKIDYQSSKNSTNFNQLFKQKIDLKQSTDTTSKQGSQFQLRLTKKTKSLKKTKGMNFQQINNNGQLEERYKNDPIFKLRVDIMMREADKKSLTRKSKSKGKFRLNEQKIVQKQYAQGENYDKDQDQQMNLRTTTLRKKKYQTQTALKKYVQIYENLIVNKILTSAVSYGMNPDSSKTKQNK